MKWAAGIGGILMLAGAAAWLIRQGYIETYDYQAAFEPAATTDARAVVLLDVKGFAGKDKAAVREQLGEPLSCEAAQYSERCRYALRQTEITYIDGKADWITVPLYDSELPLQPQTLASLGLPVREPDELDEHESIWRSLAGYREVRLAGGSDGASYARIKVATR